MKDLINKVKYKIIEGSSVRRLANIELTGFSGLFACLGFATGNPDMAFSGPVLYQTLLDFRNYYGGSK